MKIFGRTFQNGHWYSTKELALLDGLNILENERNPDCYHFVLKNYKGIPIVGQQVRLERKKYMKTNGFVDGKFEINPGNGPWFYKKPKTDDGLYLEANEYVNLTEDGFGLYSIHQDKVADGIWQVYVNDVLMNCADFIKSSVVDKNLAEIEYNR